MPEPGELKPLSFADQVSVVLLKPQQSLNVGSVARAMMNLGFSKLILIAPDNYDINKAAVTGRWALPVLEQAVIADDLQSALAGFNDVVGFGGRYDGLKFETLPLPEWAGSFQPLPGSRTALLFGPEDRGLNSDEINHCRRLIRIPSTAEYPSYNLAQAVLLALYELTRLEWSSAVTPREERELPEWNDFFQLERLLDEVLTATGFYREGTPAPVPGVIKRLFRRMDPDKREIGILLAMVSRIKKNLKIT